MERGKLVAEFKIPLWVQLYVKAVCTFAVLVGMQVDENKMVSFVSRNIKCRVKVKVKE